MPEQSWPEACLISFPQGRGQTAWCAGTISSWTPKEAGPIDKCCPLGQLYPSLCSAGKEAACNAGDPGSIPGSGRSAGEGIGYPL